MNIKLAKRSKIILDDFTNSVEFDKDQYKKPKPFFGNIHDPYLTPSDENFKKKKKDLQTKTSLIVNDTGIIKEKRIEYILNDIINYK